MRRQQYAQRPGVAWREPKKYTTQKLADNTRKHTLNPNFLPMYARLEAESNMTIFVS